MQYNRYKHVVGATVLIRYEDKHLYGEVEKIDETGCEVRLPHHVKTIHVLFEDILHWYYLE